MAKPKATEQKRNIIVIGASAGGVAALTELVRALPEKLPASVFVVMHLAPYSHSALPEILSKAGPIKAVHPKDGEKIEQGKIYVACPDYHLLVEEDHVIVKKGPKENRFRPSIDALFRSAAYVYGPRVIGIVLSGALNDGTSGLWTVKRQGGLAIVQEPADATYSDMPKNVLQYVEVDHTVPVAEMAALITRLSAEEAPGKAQMTKQELERLKLEVIIATRDNAFEMGIMDQGELTPFTCPSCHGTLVRLKEADIIRFRCHTGHAFTASALLSGVSETIEDTLWQAMRALEENTMLLKHLGEHFKKLGHKEDAQLFLQKAGETSDRARVVHDSVFKVDQLSADIRFNLEKKEKKENGKKANKKPKQKDK